MKLSRRDFLVGIGLAAADLALEGAPADPRTGPVYDFHVHLFGEQEEKTGCWISDRQRNHWTYPLFRRMLNLRKKTIDDDYVNTLVSQLLASSVEKSVLMSYDWRYDEQGREDRSSSNVYVPNEYLFQVVARYPDLFIPCVSINPKRRDVMDELDKCAEAGARALKIHPPTQDVDPAEERFRPFYRRVAEHGIILMVHTGAEHASEIVGNDYSDPARLLPALEEGCTVIASHIGMGSFFDDDDLFEGFFQNFLSLVKRFPNLYCDTAVLANRFRWRNIPRLLREPAALDRAIHASDWPFPSNALVFWNRLAPSQLLSLCAEPNLFERDFRLKQGLGLPPAVFERGAKLLALIEPTPCPE